MDINNLTLAYQVLSLKPILENSFINKIQDLDRDTLKIKVHTKEGSKDIIVKPNILYLSNYKLAVGKESHGLGGVLKKYLFNQRIVSFSQHAFDRIAVMEFSDYFLIFELFSNSNIILTDKNYKILRVKKKEEWKDRSLKKDELYKFPSSRAKNILEISFEEFEQICRDSDQSIVVNLIKNFNVAPPFAEEVCHKMGLDKKNPSKEVEKKSLKKTFELIQDFYGNIDIKKLAPYFDSEKEQLLPFKLESISDLEKVESLNKFFDDKYSIQFLEKEKSKIEKKVKEKVGALEFNLNQLLEAEKKFEKDIIENQKKGDLIYAHFNEIQELIDAIQTAIDKKVPQKEIETKLKAASKIFKKIDLKQKKLVLEIKE